MTRDMNVYRSWLAEEGKALAAALDGNAAAAVPSCPGWSVTDLASHVGSQHRWVADLLNTVSQEPRMPYSLTPDPEVTLAEWYRASLDLLLDAVDASDPDASMWTVTLDQKAGAWCRRQVHELTVHRWDAENARGRAQPVEAERAEDSIDELFETLLPYLLPFFGRSVPDVSLALRSEDGAYGRRVDGAGGRIRLSRDPQPADTVLSGTPSDLLLALWRRPHGAVLTGDPAGLVAWQEAIAGRAETA